MADMLFVNGASGGGMWWPAVRWPDAAVPKFSGHTSHGTIKVMQIRAPSGHTIFLGLGIFYFPPWAIDLTQNDDPRPRNAHSVCKLEMSQDHVLLLV